MHVYSFQEQMRKFVLQFMPSWANSLPGREIAVKTLRHYRIDLGIAAFIGIGLLVLMGVEALVRFAILGVLEVSFSFDNAVVNAAVLATMSLAWQKRFMTWGILVAVAGMRFVFPVLIVSLTAHIGFVDVIRLAVQHPLEYADKLHAAHPQIAILGGTYLLLIFLSFVFEERQPTWLTFLERPLSKVGKLDMMPVIVAGTTVLVISQIMHNMQVLLYGFVSLLLFVAVNSIANVFENEDEEDDEESAPRATGVGTRTGMAGFASFMYLEAQDASFSFDGVSGAFAVTDKVILIALGLGIGALFVRSMTVHLLRSGTLAEYQYLEHGAHWAIGTLAVCMLSTLFVEIPDYITGLIGVVFIAAAIISSIRKNKSEQATTPAPMSLDDTAAAVDGGMFN